jgi:hypothetical protein
MLTAADANRRSLGLFFLLLACVLVIWGQTLLKPYLGGLGFMIYWLACFLCLGVAIAVALLDILILRRRIRVQQEELIKRTLMEIELEQAELVRDARKDAAP